MNTKDIREQVRSWYADWNVDRMPSRVEEKLIALIDSQILQARIDELNQLQKHYEDMFGDLLLVIEERLATLTKQQEGK